MAYYPMSRLVFSILVAAVVLLPLPLAGLPQWAWTSYAVIIGALLLASSLVHDQAEISLAARRLAIPLGLCLAFCLYVGYQTLPHSAGNWEHPLWEATAAALPGNQIVNSLALDRSVTLDALTRFVAYLGTFWLAFLFGGSSRNASLMLKCFAMAAATYAIYGLIVFSFLGNGTVLWFEKYTYLDDLTATFILAYPVNADTHYMLGAPNRRSRVQRRSAPQPRPRSPAMI